jgi:Ca2+-binding RTX toxin-like protein
MAISINFSDANSDGKGIDFKSYMKTFDKKYEASNFGGFVNEDYDDGGTPGNMNDDVWHGDDYVTWDGRTNGQSVIFEGGRDGWKYVFDGHVMGGDLTAITFGTGTKENNSNPEYTNNGEIRISFDEMEIPDYSKSWISDLSDNDLKKNSASLMKFLNSDSIEFNGSDGKDKFTGFNKADTLHGEAGADTLGGGKGNDIIYGDEGNDKLSGGKGIDTFVFESGDGKDTISDFGKGADVIDFSGQFASFEEIIDAATDGKKGVTIAYEGGSVTLTGWEVADLSEGHFLLA